MSNAPGNTEPLADFYVPDLCASRSVLAVVLIAALVAILLSLSRDVSLSGFFPDLARTSLLILWMALTSTALLCAARNWLATLGTTRATAIALLIVVANVVIVSEVVYWIGQWVVGSGAIDLFPQAHWPFLLRNLLIGAIVASLTLRYFYVRHQWQRNVEREAMTRIEALQARIRPHFLFNSMNTIAALISSNPDAAEQAVEDLADLFRASLGEPGRAITLGEELDIVRTYERMEQQRLGDRLEVEWQLKDLPLEVRVPSLIIQPLLENAIYHGIEPSAEGGTVAISGHSDGKLVHFVITNPVDNARRDATRPGNHLAQQNIRERLQLAWGDSARLGFNMGEHEYVAKLCFPIENSPWSSRDE